MHLTWDWWLLISLLILWAVVAVARVLHVNRDYHRRGRGGPRG